LFLEYGLRCLRSIGRNALSLDIIDFMSNPISCAFFGSSENSLTVLRSLTGSGMSLKLVVSAPPRPAGRKQIISKTPVHIFAENHNIPVKTPAPLKDTTLKVLNLPELDVAIVADYAQLIPKVLLDYPKHSCLNLHPSLLPKFRGSTPGEMAILHGEKETGMTIIRMDEKFDHGPIISQFKEEIRNDDTSETLYRRLFTKGAEVLTTILPAWVEGRISPRQQDHSQATLAPRLTRDDGFIPWRIIQAAMNGETDQSEPMIGLFKFAAVSLRKKDLLSTPYPLLLERATRALYPWPGVWTKIQVKDGEKRLKILSAHLDGNRLTLDNVQLEGKQSTTFSNFQASLA